jgi:hypothetical protein
MGIRTAMNLVEAPGLLSGPEDFGLNDPKTNRQKAAFLDSPQAETLREDHRFRLAILDKTDGAIGLVVKQSKRLYYYVRYQSQNIPFTGHTVTQVELWRRRGVEECSSGASRPSCSSRYF